MATTRTPRTPGDYKPAAAQAIAALPDPTLADGMPNAIDIDPKTIEAPVLTRQGWVVPDEEHRKLLRDLAAAKKKLGIE